MVHLLAAAAIALVASAPCPVASQQAAQAFVATDIAQEIAVLEVLLDAEQEYVARVANLGLAGAAPLFGANRDAVVEEGLVSLGKARETGEARRAAVSWPAW
jgi:hypothetical protein